MNIIISGGTRGIGKALVERFTRDGRNVVFFYRSRQDLAAELSRSTGAIGIRADLSVPREATDAMMQAVKALGGLDVLINNAGISQIKLFTELSDEDWHSMLNTNLSSAFYLSRAAAREMVKNHNGRILNIGSMWGKIGASCEVPYSAAKAGLRGMTMALAKELAPSGITVNCIEPGVIVTEMNAFLEEETLSALREETPMGRLGRPEEVAALAAFLASDEAAFITGQCIGIDGGFAV